MTHLLVIDDESVFHDLITKAFAEYHFQVSKASTGMSGLAMARNLHPDVIICDVMMPDVTGYDVVSSLRREQEFAQTPIIMLTAQTGLDDKLKAFEAGADDHISKPFEPAELAARVIVLLRRFESIKATQDFTNIVQEEARMIAVHSLRGGTGCSSISANLAIGLQKLWGSSVNLIDLTMMSGQVALMLNASLKRTWSDIMKYGQGELDEEVLTSIISHHDSGLDFIAGPTLPSEADAIRPETLGQALKMIRKRYDYIVADLPHDFHEITLQALDLTDMILMVATPDMASVRASAAALDTYKKLGYPKDQIRMLINATFPRMGIQHEKIANALGIQVSAIIPYSPDLFVEGINLGKPFILSRPSEPVSELIEDLAFNISKPTQKKSRPDVPSESWLRVYKRYNEKKTEKTKK